MAKNAYPRFSPARTYKHDILGRVKVFDFTDGKSPASDGNGAQTDFYSNGAEVDNPKHFGIKLFSTSIEAFAAYQRQRLAAKARCAPPVGCMVQWKIGRWSRWGYETCIADTSKEASKIAVIVAHPKANKVYKAWCKHNGVAPHNIANNLAQFTADGDYDLAYKKDNNGKVLFRNYVPVKRDSADLRADSRIIKNDWGYCPKWNIDNFHLDSPVSLLRKRLRAISITGTQYDHLWDLHDDGNNSFARDRRLVLGGKWRKADHATMGNDLHNGNIALWHGRAVCIDFGFHCVISALIGEHNPSEEEMCDMEEVLV